MKISIVNGSEILISETVFNGILVVLLISIFSIIVNSKIKKARVDRAPSNFLNIAEIFVEFIDSLVKGNMDEKNLVFAPLMGMLISYLAVANTISLFGLTSPTSDYSVTLTLGLVVFGIIQFFKFKTRGGPIGYIKSFAEPVAVMTPINIISEFINPISMSFRLFGNVMSGSLILALIHGALGYFSPIVTVPLHLYFDIFTGILQAYIFVMLSMIYIDGATA